MSDVERNMGEGPEDNGNPGGKLRIEGGRIMDIAGLMCLIILAYYFYAVYFSDYAVTKESMAVKAKQDCDALAMAVNKYNMFEGAAVKSHDMIELRGRYVPNFDRLRDPWGSRYIHDHRFGEIFSMGPDRAHDDSDPAAACNADDITVAYAGAIELVEARLDKNPQKGNFYDGTETERRKCFDELHLYFSRDVAPPAFAPDLSLAAATPDSDPAKTAATPEAAGKAASAGIVFRYFVSENGVMREIPCPADLAGACRGDFEYRCGADSREVVIRLASGFTSADPRKKLLSAGTHYIDVTGTAAGGNACFKGIGSGRRPGSPVASSNKPVQIKAIN